MWVRYGRPLGPANQTALTPGPAGVTSAPKSVFVFFAPAAEAPYDDDERELWGCGPAGAYYVLLNEHAKAPVHLPRCSLPPMLVLLSLALRVPEADVHCRPCYASALQISRVVGGALSLRHLAQDMRGFWDRFVGPPRAVFVCVAAVCGFSAPTGHIMVIKTRDVAMGRPMESAPPECPAVHAGLMP